MAADWVPYALIILVVVLISGCVYVWKHRAEVFEMAGIDPPDLPGLEMKKKTKKNKPIHLGRKNVPKVRAPEPQKETSQNLGNQNEVVKRAPKRPAKEPKIITRNKGLSDLPLETNNVSVKSLQMNKEGFLTVVGKDKVCHLFVSQYLDAAPEMLTQHFELDQFEVTNAAMIRAPRIKIVYTENQHKNLVIASIAMDEEKAVFKVEDRKIVEKAYASTCQGLIAHPNGEYIAMICDSKALKVFNAEGESISEETFEGKKITTIAANNDYSRFFVGVGASIVVFDWNSKKRLLTQKCAIETKISVLSMAYSQNTGELVAVTNDNIVTLYNKKIESGKVKEQWEVKGARLVIASPQDPYIAIFCAKAQMKIVQIKTGKVYADLNESHEGYIDFASWSVDGKWIFTASKAKPKVESFRFSVDK